MKSSYKWSLEGQSIKAALISASGLKASTPRPLPLIPFPDPDAPGPAITWGSFEKYVANSLDLFLLSYTTKFDLKNTTSCPSARVRGPLRLPPAIPY